MYNFQEKYNNYVEIFNNHLHAKLKTLSCDAPSTIKEAMEYAILGGGKRVRPVLCLACADILGVNHCDVLDYALAIELIHTYSLVHDDLPSMDNDDYRRGRLSTHKKFGEAVGVLTGDALLTFAFEICLQNPKFSINDANALRVISEFAGYNGMIAGQILDLQNENSNSPCENILYSIYENKTAKLLTAPLLIAPCFKDKLYSDVLKDFGYHLGITFQITDDILDVVGSLESIGKTPNKDEKVGKLTAVRVLGLDSARERANFHKNKCLELLSSLPNSKFLSDFIEYIYNRKN